MTSGERGAREYRCCIQCRPSRAILCTTLERHTPPTLRRPSTQTQAPHPLPRRQSLPDPILSHPMRAHPSSARDLPQNQEMVHDCACLSRCHLVEHRTNQLPPALLFFLLVDTARQVENAGQNLEGGCVTATGVGLRTRGAVMGGCDKLLPKATAPHPTCPGP
eukprot:86217-Rhodomonas_salina.2